MTLTGLLAILEGSPIIASVQASPGSPTADPAVLTRLAQASVGEGVRLLRLEGAATVRAVREATDAPCIGLVKRDYEGSQVYITPTLAEVDELLATTCEVVALDVTARVRPGGCDLQELVAKVHSAGRLALADCDTLETGRNAAKAGCDILSTTLSGYTPESPSVDGPDLALVRDLVGLGLPVLAEGRYQEEWQIQAALCAGAVGVVVGGALNDPVKQTRRFVGAAGRRESVAAFDLGGTWLRFGHFSASLELLGSDQVPTPSSHAERIDWMSAQCKAVGINRVGVSAGGRIWDNVVQEAKGFIPDYVGRGFHLPGCEVLAANDGLATAWGHSMHPDFAGKRVATLALGTGVGAGIAERGRLFIGQDGDYPRVNDSYLPDGRTIEAVLGGLSANADESELVSAFVAAVHAVQVASPEVIVLCGGVGLGRLPLFLSAAERHGVLVVPSPYGANAGLVGAATLAAYPPAGLATTKR